MKAQLTLRILALVLFSTLSPQLTTVLAQGTAFTYQGRLNDGGIPANGTFDLTFALFSVDSGPGQVGNNLTNSSTGVSNGLFTVILDFGQNFPGANRWLEIGVRTNGNGAFTTLTPRQQLTPSPYAIMSGGSSNLLGSLPAAQISGALSLTQLPGALVTNNGSGVTLNGAFSGNGFGLTNVDLAHLSGRNIAWGSFASAFSLGVGNGPYSVVGADVNGDGKIDLISVDGNDNAIIVFINNGNGGFGLAITNIAGNGPVSVTAKDINGDGKLDLITANFTDNTLSVLTNNGSGGFTLASSPAVGSMPHSVVATDINGDGKLDLICANAGTNTLSVLTNKGGGIFSAAVTYTVGQEPAEVVAADVNGDGKMDLISANLNDDTISLLINNGSGGFAPAINYHVGPRPFSVKAADLNGDGKIDLVIADEGTNTLSVVTNDGSGGFSFDVAYTVGKNPVCVAVADLNGDGKLDLISANYSDNTISVLLNNGNGRFGAAINYPVGQSPDWVVAADVIGNGKPALVSANYLDNSLSVLLNTPLLTGGFAGNFNGDGAGLTNLTAVNSTALNGLGAIDFWQTAGNTGTTAGSNFLGTTDSQPLEMKVNGARVMRFDLNFNIIGGDPGNSATGGAYSSTIAGGGTAGLVSGQPGNNSISAYASTIGGGAANTIQNDDDYSTVAGGALNAIMFNAEQSTISGGYGNTVQANARFSTVGGGVGNSISTNGSQSVIGGGTYNASSARSATIGGGNQNSVTGDYGTVPGGDFNVANTNSFAAGHRAQANYQGDFVWADSTEADFFSTARDQFLIRASGGVGIGKDNPNPIYALDVNGIVNATGLQVNGSPVIAGGSQWTPVGNNIYYTAGNVGIGTSNPQQRLHVLAPQGTERIQSTNSANGSVIEMWNDTSSSTYLGAFNFINGSGIPAVEGQLGYLTGKGITLSAGGSERMRVGANGNVGIGTSVPGHLLVVGSSLTPAYCDGSSWVNGSDRNSKEGFATINPRAVLDKVSTLPITEWQYKADADGNRHLGPMAQDFHAAFGLNGTDDKHIATVDESGVALAAIQGLNQKVEALHTELERRALENAGLKQDLDNLKQIVASLNQKRNQGAK